MRGETNVIAQAKCSVEIVLQVQLSSWEMKGAKPPYSGGMGEPAERI
jgi:hypothetical protein